MPDSQPRAEALGVRRGLGGVGCGPSDQRLLIGFASRVGRDTSGTGLNGTEGLKRQNCRGLSRSRYRGVEGVCLAPLGLWDSGGDPCDPRPALRSDLGCRIPPLQGLGRRRRGRDSGTGHGKNQPSPRPSPIRMGEGEKVGLGRDIGTDNWMVCPRPQSRPWHTLPIRTGLGRDTSFIGTVGRVTVC
jgi:hypothetical protein